MIGTGARGRCKSRSNSPSMTESAQDGARADLCRAAQRRCQATHQGQPEAAQASRLTLSPSDQGVMSRWSAWRLDRFVVQAVPLLSCDVRPHGALPRGLRGGGRPLRCAQSAGPARALGGQQDCTVLPAAKSTVGTDERFECRDVKCRVFDAAVEVEVGASGIMTARRSTRAAWSPYGWRGSCPVTSPVSSRTRPCAPRAHGTPAESRPAMNPMPCGRRAGNELGPAFLQILQTESDAGVHIQRAEIS